MKKVHLVVLDSQREQSLEELKDIGVMHLDIDEAMTLESDHIAQRNTIVKALEIMPESEEIHDPGVMDLDFAISSSKEIQELKQKKDDLSENLKKLQKEIDFLLPWGDFDPESIQLIREKGVDIRLYEVTKEQLKELNGHPETLKTFIVGKLKAAFHVACIIIDYKDEPHLEEYPVPEKSLSLLMREKNQIEEDIFRIDVKIEEYSTKVSVFKNALEHYNEQIEFQSAVEGMERDSKIAHISGFVPKKKVDLIKKRSAHHGWGYMIADPSDDDRVPTLVENNFLIRAIKPVFNLLETIPGYKEFDISIWFLMFFSIFWAMIVGDAGYGLIFLLLTIVGRIVFRKVSFEPFLLLFITSFATITWGTITGTWFGVETLARNEFLSQFIIQDIASFSQQPGVDKIIMHICFIIGTVQLSVAHIVTFAKYFPSLKAYGQVGWLSILWGLYFIIEFLVLKLPLKPYALYMILGGIGFVLIFSQQEGKFFKGILKGFSNSIMIVFDSIGFFSDVVSYIRLFAVGLATVEVAKSFNNMVSGLESTIPGIIAMSLILFFGHGLNIILCCMSLIVHGVRLNMLEFSGHLGMEWSGFQYKPFQKKSQ